MIDDFEVVQPPADEDPETGDRFRAAASGRDADDDEWHSDFRSYLDDPA
jgi:hypothetical protein